MASKTEVNKMDQSKGVETPAAAGSPFAPLVDLRERMDRLFDDVMGKWDQPWGQTLPGPQFAPEAFRGLWAAASPAAGAVEVKFDVADSEQAVEITAELPGLTEDEIDLTLADGVLTIKGEKKIEREEKKKDYFLTERQFGAFRRAFRVPETVDDSKISASFENGVLQVALPKRPDVKAKQKKIAISKPQ